MKFHLSKLIPDDLVQEILFVCDFFLRTPEQPAYDQNKRPRRKGSAQCFEIPGPVLSDDSSEVDIVQEQTLLADSAWQDPIEELLCICKIIDSGEKDLILHYNRLRSLLPYLIAITAASPIVEGKSTGTADNRLLYYRENQKKIPLICNHIVPEKIGSVHDYRKEQATIFTELRKNDAEILCEEWVNSRGVIIRFSRKCLEIKALDEQDCIRSDMAICAFIVSLIRCKSLPVETDQEALLVMTEDAIREGTAAFKPELEQLYTKAMGHATPEEKLYLPFIKERIERGSLAELVRNRYEREGDIVPILRDLAASLKTNVPYRG